MLDSIQAWTFATRVPRLFRGAVLHRWALVATHRGRYAEAGLLFERAAERYRAELAVEPLARLRVHQLIARVRSLESPEREAELCLEIERMLTRLDRIEALEPPHALVGARTLLANWIHSTAAAATADDPPAVDALERVA